MNSILFPGQGSQVVGMGSDFYDNFDLVKDIFKRADQELNFSISKINLKWTRRKVTINRKYSTCYFCCELFNI